MKKSLLLSLFALIAAMAVAATYPASYYTLAPETASLVGDVNNDQAVTSSDVTALYNYLLNGTTTYYSTSDVNGDGDVTASDVTTVYNVLLNGSGSSQVTTITMGNYVNVTSSAAPAQHVWKDTEDVIFVTIDGDQENMYVLVRSGGQWTLKDITGSNKAGFKTSGTIKAAFVRNADYANASVYNIPVPVDFATGTGTYTCSGKTVAINLNLALAVSRLVIYNPLQGDYITNYTCVTDIQSIVDDDYYKESRTPVGHFFTSGSNTYGIAYGIMQSYDYFHYLSQGKTGYVGTVNYSNYPLTPGKYLYIHSPTDAPTVWTRDFDMCYYDAYDNASKKTLQSSGDVILLPVGTSVSFFPQEAGYTVWDGSLLSSSNSNSTSVKSYEYTTAHTLTIEGMEVGTSTVSFSYKAPGGDTFSYNFTVKVEPSVWTAGSQLNASGVKVPCIYYNKKGTSYPSISGVTGNQWVERFEVGKGNGYALVTNGLKREVHRSTNPYSYGSFIKRYDVAGSGSWLYANKSGDVFYLSQNNGNYAIYKNAALVYNTNSSNSPQSLKADYQNGNVALIYTKDMDIYFLQDVASGAVTSHNTDYYLPSSDPNQTYGGRVWYSYQNFAVDHGLAVVKKQIDNAKIVNYEVQHTYTNWVDCYLSGTATSSVSFTYSNIPTDKEIFLTNENQLFYVSDLTNGKITMTANGWTATTTHNTGLSNIVMCRYKDGYLYGVTKETGTNGKIYYAFFYGPFNQVCAGTYTKRYVDLPQSFELKDIYLETTRN